MIEYMLRMKVIMIHFNNFDHIHLYRQVQCGIEMDDRLENYDSTFKHAIHTYLNYF